MREDDFKALLNNVICSLDAYYRNSSNSSKTEQALDEIQITRFIQSIVEHANKRYLRNFQYQLLMIDYEGDEQ